jgi:uncharacterized protein
MTCPNCGETLFMTERLKVEIDYCPKCRGVWLDKGELDKLLDIAAEQTAPQQQPKIQQPPSYKQEHYKEDYHKHQKDGYYPKKKKSFLSDFLDFD